MVWSRMTESRTRREFIKLRWIQERNKWGMPKRDWVQGIRKHIREVLGGIVYEVQYKTEWPGD